VGEGPGSPASPHSVAERPLEASTPLLLASRSDGVDRTRGGSLPGFQAPRRSVRSQGRASDRLLGRGVVTDRGRRGRRLSVSVLPR
jgi:hypothetical protein